MFNKVVFDVYQIQISSAYFQLLTLSIVITANIINNQMNDNNNDNDNKSRRSPFYESK